MPPAIALGTLGGFMGVSLALLIGFLIIRDYLKRGWALMLDECHKTNTCPVCKGPMKHDEPPGSGPAASGGVPTGV